MLYLWPEPFLHSWPERFLHSWPERFLHSWPEPVPSDGRLELPGLWLAGKSGMPDEG